MIGIICFNSLRYYQFLFKYTNILDNNNINYEVVFWNREGEIIEKESNWIHYDLKVNTFQPFYKKIYSFFKYRKFLKKQIKEKKYEKLIVLTSQTAIVLITELLTKYKKNFIFDYRDITFEKNWIYRKLINLIIKKSTFSTISSEGFFNVLEKNENIIMSHNTRDFYLLNIDKNKNEKIRVVFWGMVRQPEFNYKICDFFSKDKRFEVFYHGAGFHDKIIEYCKINNYDNIFLTGKYKLEEIKEFAQNTDIVLNLYENDFRQKPAMTVKFYDSIMYGIPMIVNKNSYMSKIVEKYKLGFVVDLNNMNFLDELYKNFLEFNYEEYEKNRTKIYLKIKNDDILFENNLMKYIGGENN